MDNLANIILTILALIIMLIFIGSIYAFFYAIITFIFSSGDAEKVKKARNSIRYMILGIVMTLGILFVFPILLKKAHVPGYQYYTASNIFAQVSRITGGLIDFTQEAAVEYQKGSSSPYAIEPLPVGEDSSKTIIAPDQDSIDTNYENLEL